MVDGEGNGLQLIRDPQRNLRAVRTPHGRWIKLVHDTQGRVVRAEDDERQWVEYRYGADDLLTEVMFSNGRARRYMYAGDLLTEVRDEKGLPLIHNWYRDGRVVMQEYANDERYRMHYSLAGNGHDASESTVVRPDGAIRTFRTEESVSQFVEDLR